MHRRDRGNDRKAAAERCDRELQSSPVPIQSNAQNVPVAAFGQFFLTHAAPVSGTNKPFAEFRGLIGRGNGAIYDQVQLYR